MRLKRLLFYLKKGRKILMYFTDTPELRKFEREMKQKPNFDRRNDYFSNNESSCKRKDIKSDDNKKFNNGG